MINKYEDYILEKFIFDMIKESKLVYSTKLISLLNKMGDNKIANELIRLYSNDVENLKYNYIDITDTKDKVSFTPDKKAQEIVGDKEETYKVQESSRYLTHSDKNDKIFERLGYDKEGRENWAPETGTIGLILNEVISTSSGKTYCLFQEHDVDDPRLSVINKEALTPFSVDNPKVWTSSRNPVNVGRLTRAILKSANSDFIDKDIEDFVNKYKATYDFMSDALKQFNIVQGVEIAYWYDGDNYVEGGGTLNNSCMAECDDDFFDIYTQNNKVSLVILYSDEGQIKGDNYTAKEIKGRALLWDCEIDGTPSKFMDRVYTTHDSDVELFKQFAEKNKWWYKSSQSMEPSTPITNGISSKKATIVVKGLEVNWDRYPYMDTLCYISTDDSTASNDEEGADRVLRDTDGEWMEAD